MERVLSLTQGKRIFLIGGRREEKRLEALSELLAAELVWVDTKRRLPLRKLEQELSGADLAMIMLDCISHTNSVNTRKAADKLDIPCILVRRALNELRVLEAFFEYVSAQDAKAPPVYQVGPRQIMTTSPTEVIETAPPADPSQDLLQNFQEGTKAHTIVKELLARGIDPRKRMPTYTEQVEIGKVANAVYSYVQMLARNIKNGVMRTNTRTPLTAAPPRRSGTKITSVRVRPSEAVKRGHHIQPDATRTTAVVPVGNLDAVLELVSGGSTGMSKQQWRSMTRDARLNLLRQAMEVLEIVT
jgi:hypothetical protein